MNQRNFSEIKLAGDASSREFFRTKTPGAEPVIRMITPQAQKPDYSKYIAAQRFLKRINLKVPEIFSRSDDKLELIIEDLGDTQFFSLFPQLSIKNQQKRYLEFINVIMMLHSATDEFKRTYTEQFELLGKERLLWELEFFLDHYLRFKPEISLSNNDQTILRRWFGDLVDIITSYPVTLCHRDFHSKNIMIHNNSAYLIDFQDIRLGPYNYDLVSLLWDSYLRVDEKIISECINYFGKKIMKSTADYNNSTLMEHARFSALQRNLKAIGTFTSKYNEGNKNYLPFIPITFKHIEDHLSVIEINPTIRQILLSFSR